MSQTQTFHRSVVNPTRNHDYLYDNTYTLSSERDHARTIYKTQVGVDRVKRVPQQAEMFSALPHFPRFQVQLEQTDPVPSHVNRRWRGFAEQRREALVRYTTFNYDPSVQVPAKTYENAKVTGVNRYKYFRRPIIPFLQQVPPEVLLQPTAVDPLAPPAEIAQRPPTPLTRTVELQTDYRDSEAQTEPYTPEYVVRPGSAPEILTLATLSYKRGLPAGLAEVEMIERARAKRAWERTLPALSDVTQLDRRKRMMDEMETKEWAVREDEIAKLQEARLEVLKRLLVEREQKQQDLNDKRLDKLWLKKQKRKEKRTETIRKHHIQCVRKLLKKRAGADGKLQRRDVVGDYGGFGSQTHAPLTRIGVFLDRGSEQYVVKSKYLDTFQGLLDLEQSLPSVAIRPQFKAPKRNLVSRGYVMRGLRLETELKDIHEAMKLEHLRGKVPSKPLRFLHKVEKPIPRPPTPRVPVPSQEEEEREQAVIVLQKVIRGRAMQNMMYEGKGERSELIDEVRSTHALQKAQQQLKRQDKQRVVTLQRQRRLYQHKSAFVDEALSRLEGKPIGDLLDFLSKELIRLEEERRIHAYSMLAERRRRIREAEESGRRQVEERRRREEDEIFKQLVKIHQQTVDTYLEDCILHAVDATADEQAREEIRQQADQINDLAYEVEANRTRLQSEEIVSELVHSFLLPEIMKIDSRQKIKLDQRKHLLAAHRIIHATTEPIIESAGDDVIDAPELATGSDPAPGDVTAADDGTAEDDVTRDEVKGAVEEVTSEQLVVAQVFEDEPEFTEEVLKMSSAPEEEYMEAELMEDEEEVVALEVPPDVPAEDVIIAEPKVVVEPEVADHVIVAQPEIIAQQEVAIDEIAAPEVDDVTTERVAEPDVKADDVIVEEPEAVVKQLEPEAAADDVTAEQPDAADDVTAEKPEALVDDVTTEQPEAAADDVTTEQQEVTAQDVTAEQPDAADDVTAEQPEAAIDDVTAEKPEAAVDDVTTEQPEATVQDVITDQSEDAVDDVTEKLETE